MASYNGITIKALKKFKDHEGISIAQGNIYIENKKVGFWSQDAWCGPDIVNLDPKYDERKLEEACAKRGQNLEITMYEALRLTEDEKDWKKSGWPRMFVADDGVHVLQVRIVDPKMTVDDVLKIESVTDCIKESFFKDEDRYSYKIIDADSVDVGDPITLDEIRKG